MKKIILVALILSSRVWAVVEASVDIKLSPAGSFVGKTPEVIGVAKKVGTKYVAENIVVNLKNLKTGMGLRDQHTQKYLQTAQYPTATLVKAEGENGKGKGTIRIKGIEKPIEGTYKVNGKELSAEFPIKLSDFNISGIRYMSVGVKDQVVIKVTVPIQ